MRSLAALLSVALFSTACGASPTAKPAPPPVAATPPPAAPPPTPAAPPKPTFPGAPVTPAGEQLAWVLDVIVNRHGALDAAEIEAHFHRTFLAAVPPAAVASVFAQIAAGAPGATISRVEGDGQKLVAHVALGDTKLRILLSIDPQSAQIVGLRLQPDVDVGPQPASFDEARDLLGKIAPKSTFLVAELKQGACAPIQSSAPKDELAIGSTFKLYVLLALADQMRAGKAAWADELAIRDDWKSLPSGRTQADAAGTKLSLLELAERMISISDNTAADHLLQFVGRKAVEAALRATQHARPALDAPFLTTREMFVLKLGQDADARAYLALNEARKRDYLDKTIAGTSPDLAAAKAWSTAHRIDTLEWFASSDDLCRAMAALWTRSRDPKTEPIAAVLAKNPGLPLDAATWPYIGYKGGSEPGVMNMTYLLRRKDDRWFVVTAGVNAAEGGTVDESKVIGVVTGLVALAAGAK